MLLGVKDDGRCPDSLAAVGRDAGGIAVLLRDALEKLAVQRDVAGGKLTTYRLMGEQTVDQIVRKLKDLKGTNGAIARCRTAQDPLLSPAETRGLSGIVPPDFG